jgi:hypothetical protein
MNNNAIKPTLTGFLGLSLVALAAFLPWFQWTFEEGNEIWYGSSSLSGPPAIIFGAPYATVEALSSDLAIVNRSVAVYLVIFLVGIGLWATLLWRLRQEMRRWILAVVGLGAAVGWAGLVMALELSELIAQRTGLYAATVTDRSVVADLDRFQVMGPALVGVGIGVQLVAIIFLGRRNRRTRRRIA